MAALSLQGVKKTYDSKQFVVARHRLESTTASSSCWSVRRAAARARCCAWSRGSKRFRGGDLDRRQARRTRFSRKQRNIAMVFQNYALYPHMSVAQNMAFALKIRGVSATRFRSASNEAREDAELEPLLAESRAQLVGRSTATRGDGPRDGARAGGVLFDEPLSNLDAKLRVQMRPEIQRAACSVLRPRVLRHARSDRSDDAGQRIVVMNAGRIEQIGPPLEVYERPAKVFVASFIGSPAMNLLEGRVSDDGSTFDVAGNGPRLPLTGMQSLQQDLQRAVSGCWAFARNTCCRSSRACMSR